LPVERERELVARAVAIRVKRSQLRIDLKLDGLEPARGNRNDLQQAERCAADLRSAEDQDEREVQECGVQAIRIRRLTVAVGVEHHEIAQVREI